MPFVVDCSVAACWFLPDQTTAYTERAFRKLKTDTAHVPALWVSELCNVMLKLERQGKLAKGLAAQIIADAELLGLAVEPPPPMRRVFELAQRHHLSAYDATYLELAIRTGFPLAALDGALKSAASKFGLYLSK